MSRAKRSILAVAAAPLVLIVALIVAWGVDAWASSDRVGRNISVSGTNVGNQTSAELTSSIEELAERFPDTAVEMDVDDFEIATNTAGLGLGVDVDATTARIMDMGRNDPWPTRPVRWVRSLFSERTAQVTLETDPAALTWTIAVLEGERRTQPIEPTIQVGEDAVTLVPGVPGRAITLHDVVSALPGSVADIDQPIQVEVSQAVTEPSISDGAMQELVDRANAITEGEITLVSGGTDAQVDGSRFRPAFGVAIDDGTPRLTMQTEPVAEILADTVPTSPNPTNVRFQIGPGGPVPVGGEDAQVCCEADAPQHIVDSLLADERRIELPTRVQTAAQGREWAAGLGVREVIGSFTTNHACCESRVTNIQRMADLLTGVLIPPGATFSVNDTVGRRTVEKGFLEGGVIQDGEFTTDIGGGVSQFATTLFNAAFFGGLDIPVYKAHSKYISRYPFGREATLSYPSVDLKIRNDTEYGIVIWPSYTGTSITVDLWSTRTAVGAQTAQNKSSGCGSVTTERTRTFTDGRVETDTFRANYDCE